MNSLISMTLLLPALMMGVATRGATSNLLPARSHARSLDVSPAEKVSVQQRSRVPDHFEVRQNYPNPFNASTSIEFDLPIGAFVFASVYNVLGKRIRTLEMRQRSAGRHLLQWDGRADSGEALATGVYFYVLIADGYYAIHKMVLLK